MTIGHAIIGGGPERVLVMHGWFADHTVFAPMLPYLDGARFTYAFIDYRGYGRSRDIAGCHDMAELAADALELADALGWRRYHAIGHSMGGAAIQRLLVASGERMRSAVAVTPVPAAMPSMPPEQRRLFLGATDSDDNRRAILDYSTGNRLSRAWLDWMVAQSHRTTTRDAFADYFLAWSSVDFADAIRGNPVALLAMVGEHDLALTPELMRETYLAWYPNAELHVIPNSGHYPMQETPVYFATVIERFMAAHA